MTRVFADTFYYLALLNADDEAHQRAAAFTAAFAGIMVTTDWVLTELADGLAPLRSRRSAVRFIESLRNESAVRIVSASRKLLDRGWELYADRLDKEWSLTDCISFVVMRERRIQDALTADHHFEQAGFTALLK
jgi:uncharacterized protein